MRLAAAVSSFTATLLHDDVVDESAQRRGRPTANILWDNQSSVLVGDYLFSRSFQLMVETDNLRVLDILSNASAVIAEGEVLQLSAQNDMSGGEDRYFQVIRGKTAELFAAAAEVGGVISGASDEQCAALRAYGDALGVAFQLVDDVLDYGGTAAVTGKNVGDDFREGKATLPVLLAANVATGADRAFWTRVIEEHEQEEGDLEEALRQMRETGALEQTRAAPPHGARPPNPLSPSCLRESCAPPSPTSWTSSRPAPTDPSTCTCGKPRPATGPGMTLMRVPERGADGPAAQPVLVLSIKRLALLPLADPGWALPAPPLPRAETGFSRLAAQALPRDGEATS